MKNQKIQIIVLAIAIVGLGIGFAAFSNTLNISESATVTPNSSSFKVVFTKTSGREDTGSIVPVKSVNTLTASNGTIDSDSKLTLSNLGATFTEPGQSVEYNLYVYNAGAYLAHLNSVTYKGSKKCTPSNNTVNYVNQACNSITMKVKVGSTEYSGTTQDITGQSLSAKASTPVKITISYASNGARADGPFSVSFPDVSLYYMTVSGTNEEYDSTYQIYRRTEDYIAIGDSLAKFTSGYEVSASNVAGDTYLKHDIRDDIVVASYACIKYTEGGVNKEACLKGADSGSYGSYDGMSSTTLKDVSTLNPTKNIAVISKIKYIEDLSCTFNNSSASCDAGTYMATSNGYVHVQGSDMWDCSVEYNGNSSCEVDD